MEALLLSWPTPMAAGGGSEDPDDFGISPRTNRKILFDEVDERAR